MRRSNHEWGQIIGRMTGERRHVDWLQSEAPTEKQLGEPYCMSVHANHKRGKKQLSRKSLQTSMQIWQGAAEKKQAWARRASDCDLDHDMDLKKCRSTQGETTSKNRP